MKILEDGQLLRYEREFGTAIAQLDEARQWCEDLLDRHALDHDPLRYVIESTACYHFPVIYRFGGKPSVVNPLLAGPYRRKTDKLDARTLAYHGLTGLWPESFFGLGPIVEFRLLVVRRRQAVRERTRIGHQINNALLRWGHTIGARGPLTHGPLREIVDALCRGVPLEHPNISPLRLPDRAKADVLNVYERYDAASARIRCLDEKIMECAHSMQWETQEGTLAGREMMRLLQTVPGIGPVTSMIWLAEVVTPRRFESLNQVSAFIGSDPSLKVSAGRVTAHTRRKGNAPLHEALLQASQVLVGRHAEPFGQWGYVLACRYARGGWSKACSAVSRRLGGALWHVQRTGQPCTYEGYSLVVSPAQIEDLPVEDAEFSARVLKTLLAAGIRTTRELVSGAYSGLLSRKGFGAAVRGVGRMAGKAAANSPVLIGDGLSLSGRILAKSEREFKQPDGSVQICRTYRILSGIDIFFVDDWSAEVPMEPGAEVLSFPVYVKAFKNRDGAAAYRLVHRTERVEP